MRRLITFMALALLCCVSADAAKIIHTEVYSKANKKKLPVAYVLPDAYETNRSERFTAMYALNGLNSDTKIMFTFMEDIITGYCDKYNCIWVIPDNGMDSWYLDRPGKMYETFCGKVIVEYTDKHYRTKADRLHRILVGGSMGGHGALLLACLNPDEFKIVGSLAGVVDLKTRPSFLTIDFGKSDPDSVSALSNIPLFKKYGFALYQDIGFHDGLYDMNLAFHNKLKKEGIDHVYIEREGAHDYPYWREAWKGFLNFAFDTLAKLEKEESK
ncbi:MAG: hypothetical protein J6X53_00735 [Abditibacteriota bacterium]|nr:hypothetical protein [Abditibacteriota bacterium]